MAMSKERRAEDQEYERANYRRYQHARAQPVPTLGPGVSSGAAARSPVWRHASRRHG
jgi:hypothetical protein